MGTTWRIELLGGLRAAGTHPAGWPRGDPVVTRFQTRQTGLLLAYLAYHRPRSYPREGLIELLWPECEPEVGRHRLSVALSALRQRLEPEDVPAGAVIVADRTAVRLNPDVIATDVAEFEAALQSAARAGNPVERAEWLSRAVALYRGELLPGCYDDWVLQEREWLAERLFQALGQLIAHLESVGDLDRALEMAHHGVSVDPLREEAHVALMRLYATAGQPAAALRQYQELERLLQQQLETAPAPATRALAREIERLSLLPAHASLARRSPASHAAAFSREPPPTPAGGENRLVTVLFADVSRSVETTRDLDQDDAVARVNRLLSVMVDATLKYEGWVDRLLRNGMLAVFGTLQTHEDDAERSIRAALEIRQAARTLGLEVRAGINTGSVSMRTADLKQHQEQRVAGSVVNLAACLQEQAQPGEILVGEATYRQTSRAFRFTSRSPAMRGLARPVAAYAVERTLPRPEKARGIEGLRGELIGREEELAKLQAALAEALQGRGQMVSLVGEAGIGKSRLVSELKSGLTSPLWLEGRCLELGMTAGYSLFVDLFHDYLAWRPEEEAPGRAARLVAALQETVARGVLSAERAEEIGPLLGHLLSLRYGNDWDLRLKNTEPRHLRHQTLLAVRDFFLALARQEPVVLVLEDLHWADSLSLDLISLLMEALAQAPLLLLCVYRPEQGQNCLRLGSLAARKCPERYTELVLRELTPSQSRRLLASLLTIDPLPAALQDQILERADGNPFFLEEIARVLIDAGVFDPEARRVRGGAAPLKVSASVQSVICSRVDRLEPEAKRVLQVASVMGRLFRRRLLEETLRAAGDSDVGGPGPEALEQMLWELEARGLIYQERVVPEEEYSFKHVLTQETIYQSLLRRHRVVLHQQVAEAMEALYAGSLDEYPEQLAYHYERSGLDAKAVEYLLKAGEKAQRAYLNEAAVEYFQRGLARLEAASWPESRQEWQRRTAASLQESLGDVLALTGRHEEARAVYHSALAQIPKEDRIWQSRLHRRIGDTWMPSLQYENALQAYAAAEGALGEPPEEPTPEWRQEWFDLQYDRMEVHYRRSEVPEIDALIVKLRPVIEESGTPIQRLRWLDLLLLRNLRRDRGVVSDETLAYAREAFALKKQLLSDPCEITTGRFTLGLALLWRGELDEAEEHLDAALARAGRIGDVALLTFCLTHRTMLARKRGRVEEVRQYAARSLEAAAAAQRPEYVAIARANRAWVAWREGDLVSAEAEGRAALLVLEESPSFAQWTARWPLIGVALAQDQLSEAIDSMRALLDPTQQPLPPALTAVLEEACRAEERGQLQRARDALQRALELAQELAYL